MLKMIKMLLATSEFFILSIFSLFLMKFYLYPSVDVICLLLALFPGIFFNKHPDITFIFEE